MPFILSGVCSPSEANYCSNPFEVLSEFELAKGSGGQQDEHKMKPYFRRVGRRVRHDLPYKYMILLCFYFFLVEKKISAFFFLL